MTIAANGVADKTAQSKFPECFVDYAKKKIKTDRDVIEYLARFGDGLEKGMARMILAAAGEPWKE